MQDIKFTYTLYALIHLILMYHGYNHASSQEDMNVPEDKIRARYFRSLDLCMRHASLHIKLSSLTIQKTGQYLHSLAILS
jgi:hypothetical protein